jgi:hypothetical protein
VRARAVVAPLVFALACPLGCEDPGEPPDAAGSETAASTDTDTGEPEPIDSDQDGLSDDEEAELGTDPLQKDTDHDNYWDSWEIIEGTDPLDLDSRIYTGWWPYNPNKDAMPQASWAEASHASGSLIPRGQFLDRHGELVDLYDFANFTINTTGEPAYIIADISAQWCVPCHNMAFWLGGGMNADTAYFTQNFPSVPDKVHELRVWWMTFIVEGSDGDPPDAGDPVVWFSVHSDNYIPVFADVEQNVRAAYGGGFYPFLFLISPQLTVAHWGDQDPYYALSFAQNL